MDDEVTLRDSRQNGTTKTAMRPVRILDERAAHGGNPPRAWGAGVPAFCQKVLRPRIAKALFRLATVSRFLSAKLSR